MNTDPINLVDRAVRFRGRGARQGLVKNLYFKQYCDVFVTAQVSLFVREGNIITDLL